MSGGVLLMSTGSALVRSVSASYSISQILLFRMLFNLGLVVLFSSLILKQNFWRTKKPLLHMVRSLIGLLAFIGYFASLYLLPLAEVAALTLTDTIFVAILSSFLLKEKHGYRYWLAILLGFAGVIVITHPGVTIFNPASLLAVFVGFLFALVVLMIGKMAKTETFGSLNFYFTLTCVVVSFFAITFQWWAPQSFPLGSHFIGWHSMPWGDLATMLGMGLFGASGQLCITQAFRTARASLVAPFGYLDLPFSALLGFVLLSEQVDGYLIVGGLAIILSGVYILYLEKQKNEGKQSSLNLIASPS